MNLPTEPYNYQSLANNISYGELQNASFEEVSEWVDELRNELLNKWDEGLPPYMGIDEKTISEKFKKLKSYPIEEFYHEDELYSEYIGFIKNWSKMSTGCNQFFPAMLKSQIAGKSIYDFLSNENLWTEFKYIIVQKVRFDKMFRYSKYLKTTSDDYNYLKQWIQSKSCNIGFWIENYAWNKLNPKYGNLCITSAELQSLQNEGVLTGKELYNEIGYETEQAAETYTVRYYRKNKQVFPELFQILRIGLNQVATNFPPLTARWIYENYLGKHSTEMKYNVYDSSAGWGGRLLGALCSNKNIHYIGTDVNKSNVGCYEELGNFYNKHTGGKNTFEMYNEGSEVIHHNKTFMEYKDKIDLVFSSPPYFDRELYSHDPEQSCLKYPTYKEWLEGYLKQTLKTALAVLKHDNYCIINISDIKKRGKKQVIPLEQDTIQIAKDIGFEYKGKLGMCMTRMVGLNPMNTRNCWIDTKTQKSYKVEPILIFQKVVQWPWN